MTQRFKLRPELLTAYHRAQASQAWLDTLVAHLAENPGLRGSLTEKRRPWRVSVSFGHPTGLSLIFATSEFSSEN